MTKKTTLTVTVDGTTFTRTTARAYTHVLVGCNSESQAFEYAHTWSKLEEKCLRENFAFYVQYTGEPQPDWAQQSVAQYAAYVARGLDGHRDDLKAAKVAEYRRRQADGFFRLTAVSWHQGLKNAQAALKTAQGKGCYVGLRLVEIPAQG